MKSKMNLVDPFIYDTCYGNRFWMQQQRRDKF